jgi:HK97 gp10 family phage protein
MAVHTVATIRPRFVPALKNTKAAILEATQELFDQEIVPTAKELSPVTAEGYAKNVEEKKKHPSGTGTNRRSIDSAVQDTENGPQATLFTQSGYGGYLELGTSKMRAQPYLNPALELHIGKLIGKVREKLGG